MELITQDFDSHPLSDEELRREQMIDRVRKLTVQVRSSTELLRLTRRRMSGELGETERERAFFGEVRCP
jgi:hypothetical protein